MRLRGIKNKDLLDTYTNIIRDNSYKGRLSELFKNSNPIHLEVGCGKGKFIVNMALKYPHINFIAVERFDNVILRALKKSQVLPNLYYLKIDALFLEDYIGKEIDEIYLNFSDPWPKKRHIKKRLTSPKYLQIFENISKNKTVINQKTDNRKLFEYSILSLNENGYHLDDLSLDLHKDKDDIVTTEYEEKFISLGQNIYYLRGIK